MAHYATLIIPCIFVLIFLFKPTFAKRGALFEDALTLEKTIPLRGLLALCVILTHTGVPGFFKHGFLFVAIFFFLSGYGLMYGFKKKGADYFKGFIKHRFFKLFIPYWTANLVYILWITLSGGSFSIPDIVLSFILPHIQYPLIVSVAWYVCTLSLFYAFFYFAFKFFKTKIALVILIICIAIYMAAYMIAYRNWGVWYLSCLPFWFGVLVAYSRNHFKKFCLFKEPLFFVLGILIFVASIHYLGRIPCIIHQTAAITFTFCILYIIHKVQGHSKILNFFGKNSYEIYLLHYPVILMIDNTCKYIKPEWKNSVFSFQLHNEFLVVALTISITSVLAFFMHKLNEFITQKILE